MHALRCGRDVHGVGRWGGAEPDAASRRRLTQDNDTEAFVLKLWRTLIYETLKIEKGAGGKGSE